MLTASPSLQIIPINHPLAGTVRVPGSKSLTNRALLIAALANGTTRLTNALFSGDSKYFARALQTLGFDIQLDEANHEMSITGRGGKIPRRKRSSLLAMPEQLHGFFLRSSPLDMVNIFWMVSHA